MRLDQALVSRGLVPTRSRAQDLIKQGHVLVDGDVVKKPSLSVETSTALALGDGAHDFVSCAALKLAHALEHFSLDPRGVVALDLGASTGGFTEVLLRKGASRIFAVDVGTDQLHPSLRADPRVVSLEGTHAKDLSAHAIDSSLDWVVCDVSFISIMKALPHALAFTKDEATLLTLIKPQFELGPEAIGKGGQVLVPSEQQQDFIRQEIIPFFEGLGWAARGLTQSPLRGGEGTLEFLLYAQKTPTKITPG